MHWLSAADAAVNNSTCQTPQVGLNGANGVQTSWVASFLEGPQKTVGLAVYNTLGQAGED